ncbi:uncharacterized protein LOC119395979 isoform X2 [Rhipicephalus sanguineus]|uniref:uncharacterized protein LOC119395979 isoform X2 n=1 Tax=Rhipicephalus sanguineus TaxID=34632 RepID=UPI001893C460|nr:uncharacterized protein LOC119395979 isoform X2 [Rhipicephalus sanguineus]
MCLARRRMRTTVVAFLNTTETIYVYSTTDPSCIYDYDNEEEGRPSCMQYRPKVEGDDKYVFNMSYILISTWHTKIFCVELGETRVLGTPYMMGEWQEGELKELRLDVYDKKFGCALFFYIQSNGKISHKYCEIHVQDAEVESYHNKTDDICRQRAKRICKDQLLYTIYSVNCNPIVTVAAVII